MTIELKYMVALAAVAFATQAAAQVTFYENEDFSGRSFTTQRAVENFQRYGFNDRASSVVVLSDRWEACSEVGYGGRCVVLRPGSYPSLSALGMDDRVSSVREVTHQAQVDESRYAPAPGPMYDNHRRAGERLFQAEVTSVRAVFGPPEQRCWVEREPVAVQERSAPNVPGAVLGAVIGGVLGHQVGHGRGNDLATAGGAVAGAAVGANVNRAGAAQTIVAQDVQHCSTAPSDGRPQYWDVTYEFRGEEHHIQMTSPPGRSVTVNRRGEPRA